MFRTLPSKFAIRLRCAESIEWVQNLQPRRLTKLEMEGGRKCLNSHNACILNLVDNWIWIPRYAYEEFIYRGCEFDPGFEYLEHLLFRIHVESNASGKVRKKSSFGAD